MIRRIIIPLAVVMVLAIVPFAAATECIYYPTYDDLLDSYLLDELPTSSGIYPKYLAADGDVLAAASFTYLDWMILDQSGFPHLAGTYLPPASIRNITVQGNFAFLALGSMGASIVDFADPSSPYVIASIPGIGDILDLEVQGDILYLADTSVGSRIFDISIPASPTQISQTGTPFVKRLEVSDGILWEISDSVLAAYELADPTSPLQVYYHETVWPPFNLDILVADGYLHHIRYWPDVGETYYFFNYYDVSDPSSLVLRDNSDYSVEPGGITTSSTTVYLTNQEEIFSFGLPDSGVGPIHFAIDDLRPVLLFHNGLLYGGIGTNLVTMDPAQLVAYSLPILDQYSFFTDTGGNMSHVKMHGDFLFLGGLSFDGDYYAVTKIEIIDASDPQNLQMVSEESIFGFYNANFAVYGDYLYGMCGIYNWTTQEFLGEFLCIEDDNRIIGDTLYLLNGDGLEIYDLADPASPVLALMLFEDQLSYNASLIVQNDVLFLNTYEDVHVHGPPGTYERFYYTTVVDVSDPLNPQVLADLPYEGDLMLGDGNTMFRYADLEIEVLDISDPGAPVILGFFLPPDSITSLVQRGDMFYLASGENLYIGDLSDSSAPTLSDPFAMEEGFGRIILADDCLYTTNGGILWGDYSYLYSWPLDCADPGESGISPVHPGNGPRKSGSGLVLYPASPNPFNPLTTISFALTNSGPVTLQIYDVAGRHVRTLLDEQVPAGSHQVVWDGKDAAGRAVASAPYFARIKHAEGEEVQKVLLLK